MLGSDRAQQRGRPGAGDGPRPRGRRVPSGAQESRGRYRCQDWLGFWRTVKETGQGGEGQLRVLARGECLKSQILKCRLTISGDGAAWTSRRPRAVKERE